MRAFFYDWRARFLQQGKTEADLCNAIDAGELEVCCQTFVEFDFCVSNVSLAGLKREAAIYIDSDRAEFPSGSISVDEIACSAPGLRLINRPPYCYINRHLIEVTLYVPAMRFCVPPRALSNSWLRRARLFSDGSAMVDDLDQLKRWVASDLTVHGKLKEKLAERKSDVRTIRRGRKPIFGDAECDLIWIEWHRINPAADLARQIERLKEIYREKGKLVGTDERNRAEKRKVTSLLRAARTKIGPK